VCVAVQPVYMEVINESHMLYMYVMLYSQCIWKLSMKVTCITWRKVSVQVLHCSITLVSSGPYVTVLIRGLATLTQGNQELLVVKTRMEDPR